MAAPRTLVPLSAPPGVSKRDSPIALSDRWVDSDKMRFVDGKPEKIGGYTKKTLAAVDGAIRMCHEWSTVAGNVFKAMGTYRKLWICDPGDTPVDVTPIDTSGTLANPFVVTNGSTTVIVNDDNHGRAVGDTVIFDDATLIVGTGMTIDGAYVVTVVNDPDFYSIEHSIAAIGSGTGGGTVSYEYELPIGAEDPLQGDGYGAGGYGLYDYGEPTEDAGITVIFDPLVWSLANGGDLLYANPVLRGIYVFNPNDTPAYQRAEALANAPTSCRSIFITPERFLFALGVDMDPMMVAWPDQDDWTNWTVGATSTANLRRLQDGSRLIGGTGISKGISGVWTDTALYEFNYTGGSFIYTSRLAGRNAGLVSPMAVVAHQGVAYWMSRNNFLMFGGGAPRPIPRSDDVRDFVFNNLRQAGYEYKCNAHMNSRYNELWWFYTPEGMSEPGLYVGVSLIDWSWVVGTMVRTSGTQAILDQRPLLGSTDGWLYQHEDGKDADGEVMLAYIQRGPLQLLNGGRLGEINGLVADMHRQTGTVAVETTTYERMNDGPIDTEIISFDPGEDLIDMRIGGRLANVLIRSDTLGGDFRLGAPQLEVIATGARR